VFIVRQSTARTVTVGPILDADGVAVTDGVVGDMKISKNGAAPAALNGSATLTHRHTGFYSLALTASDLDTVGTAEVTIDDTVNACPMKELSVIEAAVYDALFAASATGLLPANLTEIDGEATAGNNATLNLKQLNIVNNDGDAFLAQSTGGNGVGMLLSGHGTGEGLSATGGATGHGFHLLGGATSGHGLRSEAVGTGSGFLLLGVASNPGLSTTGGSASHGILAVGGATSGNGILAAGSGTGAGLHVQAGGAGADVVLANEDAPTLAAVFFNNNSTETYASAVAGSVVKEIADNAGGGTGLTVAAIADAVWDEARAGHVSAGTFGEYVNATPVSGSITAATIATGAIDADAIAADAVTEIQSGLATAASITALNNLSAAQVNAEVLDVLNTDTFVQPTGVPSATVTLAEKIGRLYQMATSEMTVTATARTFYTFAGSALWKQTLADDGTTFSATDATTP
jgi:hypothetical protein